MPGYSEFDFPGYRGHLNRDLHRRAEHTGEQGEKIVRRLISTPGSPSRRSSPGESPFKQSGNLGRSIGSNVGMDRNYVYTNIGSNSIIARFLHRGTGKMKPRPFLTRLLDEYRSSIKRLLIGGR